MRQCINLRLITLTVISMLITACGDAEWLASSRQGASLITPEYCLAYPTDPSCNGTGSSLSFQTTIISSLNDGALRLTRNNINTPDIGNGSIILRLTNNTQESIMTNTIFDAANSPQQLVFVTLCQVPNAFTQVCSDSASPNITTTVLPGQSVFYLIQVRADGTITFVPEVNSIRLNFVTSNALFNKVIKIPVIN